MNRFDLHGPEFFLLCGVGGLILFAVYLLLGRSPSGGSGWGDSSSGCSGCGDGGD